MESGILAAVGASARNNDIDVETIQRLLNRVPLPIGPPSPLLAEDGDCGPLTIAAIKRFQLKVLGFQDGVIEPFRNTHKKLIDLAGNAELPPSRTELAESIIERVQSLLLDVVQTLEMLRLNPSAPGPKADMARQALKVHFLLDDGRDDHIGRVKHIFAGVHADITHRNLFWRQVTMKQAKIELNQRIGAKIPAIYFNFNARAAVTFTPNYKRSDAKDGLGYGPQMLEYVLITGLAKRAVGYSGSEPLLESDSPGFPGADFQAALDNPAAFGSYAIHLKLGFAKPLGERVRGI